MMTTVASLAERMRPVLVRYGVLGAGVFGSYAKGDATSGSDVDLLVELPPGSSLLDLVGLQLDLGEALGLEVDANTYRAIHPLLRERILGDEIRILRPSTILGSTSPTSSRASRSSFPTLKDLTFRRLLRPRRSRTPWCVASRLWVKP